MDNEYLIRKLVKLFQYKQNQLLKGKLLGSAVPNTLVDVQTNVGIKKALNLNITNAIDDCLVTKDIDSNQLVVFSLPKSSNVRNIEIINRKQRSIKEEAYTLDTAILYAIRETKSYSVNFINPTWEIEGSISDGYVCTPRPEGNIGNYPSVSTCLQFANQYWQDYVNYLDQQYEISYNSWLNEMDRRDQAYANIDVVLPQYLSSTSDSPNSPERDEFAPIIVYKNEQTQTGRVIILVSEYRYSLLYDKPDINGNGGDFLIASYHAALRNSLRTILDTEDENGNPLPAPVRPSNPPLPISVNASNVALSFYYRSSLNKEAIKLIEINEKEAFEAIVIKNTTTEVPIIKVGRVKETIYEPDLSSSSSNGQYEYHWVVNDLESWYKIIFYNTTNLNQNTEYYYGDFISSNLNNYQNWRYQNFYIYPSIPTDQPCKTGTNYISQIALEDKYKSVADYQSLSNFTNNKLVSIETINSIGNTYNFNCEDLIILDSSNYTIKITDYKIKENSNNCNKTKQSSLSKNIVLPTNLVFVLFKPFITK